MWGKSHYFLAPLAAVACGSCRFGGGWSETGKRWRSADISAEAGPADFVHRQNRPGYPQLKPAPVVAPAAIPHPESQETAKGDGAMIQTGEVAPIDLQWEQWVKELKHLTASERLLLTELAHLADVRGVILASRRDLAEVAGLALRTVDRCLARLEHSGLLGRTPQRDGKGRWVRLRIQLRNQVRFAQSAGPDDLGGLLLAAQSAQWQGLAAARLAELLTTQMGTRLGWLCAQLRLDLPEALGMGWLVMREQATSIAAAQDPWAYWAKVAARELRHSTIGKIVGPKGAETTRRSKGRRTEQPLVPIGVDDFGVGLQSVVGRLQAQGLKSASAYAAVARTAQIVASHGLHQGAKLVPTDIRLAQMGIGPAHADMMLEALKGLRVAG